MDITATPASSGSIPNSLLERALVPLDAVIQELEALQNEKNSHIYELVDQLLGYRKQIEELNRKIEQGNYNFTLPERLKRYEDGYYERRDEIDSLQYRIRQYELQANVHDSEQRHKEAELRSAQAQNLNIQAMLRDAEAELYLATAEADRLDDELTLATAEATSLYENMDEIIVAAGGLALAHIRLRERCAGEGIFGIDTH